VGFTKTTWVNGGAPGISATELARIETGIDQLWKQQRDIVVYTADHTLVIGDAGKIVEANKATAIVVTIPPNSAVPFPVGTQIEVVAVGAGDTSIAAGVGVTLRHARSLTLTTRWSGGTIYQRAADEWVALGDFLP
jgi:hypothetical protein